MTFHRAVSNIVAFRSKRDLAKEDQEGIHAVADLAKLSDQDLQLVILRKALSAAPWIGLGIAPFEDVYFSGHEVANVCGYRRVEYLGGWSLEDGTLKNSHPIPFPVATCEWGNVVSVGLFTDGRWACGELYYYGPAGAPGLILKGTRFVFAAGDVALSLVEERRRRVTGPGVDS